MLSSLTVWGKKLFWILMDHNHLPEGSVTNSSCLGVVLTEPPALGFLMTPGYLNGRSGVVAGLFPGCLCLGMNACCWCTSCSKCQLVNQPASQRAPPRPLPSRSSLNTVVIKDFLYPVKKDSILMGVVFSRTIFTHMKDM